MHLHYLVLAAAKHLAGLDALINSAFNVTLKSLVKIFKHGGTTRQDNVLTPLRI